MVSLDPYQLRGHVRVERRSAVSIASMRHIVPTGSLSLARRSISELISALMNWFSWSVTTELLRQDIAVEPQQVEQRTVELVALGSGIARLRRSSGSFSALHAASATLDPRPSAPSPHANSGFAFPLVERFGDRAGIFLAVVTMASAEVRQHSASCSSGPGSTGCLVGDDVRSHHVPARGHDQHGPEMRELQTTRTRHPRLLPRR